MTTVVAALERAARQCGVTAPSDWITSTDESVVELRDDFLLETISDIQDRVDLPSPIGAQTTITGDGSESYDLPADFVRTQRGELAVYDVALDRPCIPVTEDGQWTYIKDIGAAGVTRFYRVTGYEGDWSISFYNPPSAADTVTVSYVTDKWMANAGTPANAFTASDDVLLLPRRVIEAGVVWRFRERKGFPFEGKYNEYEIMIARLINDRRQRRRVDMGGRSTDVRWQDLIPSFIPPS